MRITINQFGFDQNEIKKLWDISKKQSNKNNIKVESKESAASVLQKKIYDDLVADKIARKIARGEILTEEEKETIRRVDPEKLRKAEMTNKRREKIEKKLRNAKNRKEAKAILTEAKMEASLAADRSDLVYGGLLTEAVKKAESDYYEKNNKNFSILKEEKLLIKKGRALDVKL